jgi:hypothetical protein
MECLGSFLVPVGFVLGTKVALVLKVEASRFVCEEEEEREDNFTVKEQHSSWEARANTRQQ